MSLLFAAVLLHRTRFGLAAPPSLQIRLKPLPAPHHLRLRFEGLRDRSVSSAATRLERSVGEKLDEVSHRLDSEENDLFHSVVDSEMEVLVFAAGTDILRQGDVADAFYVIESGEVLVAREKESGERETLATLGPGDVFGELGLLRGQPRNATCTVAPHTDRLVVLRCSADAYERLLGSLNIVGDELVALIRRRKVAASLGRLVPSLDRKMLGTLVGGAHFRRGRAGDVFVREGEPADAFYVIERGSFEVVRSTGPGSERLVARLGEGDFFGEVGILRGAPRNATVRVASDCQQADALVVGKDDLLRLLEPGSHFRQRVFEELGRRSTGPQAR